MFDLLKKNVFVLPITRDLTSFEQATPTFKKTNLHKKILLFVGSFTPSKGISLLQTILPSLLKHHPDAFFIGIGKGPMLQDLKHSLSSFKDQILFTGKISHDHVASFMQSADIVLFPSLWEEPLSGVLFEAMACKKTLVASDRGGNKEVLVHKTTGFLLDPLQPQICEQTLETLLKNKQLRLRIGKQAYRFWKKTYSSDAIISQLEEIYHYAIKNNKR